MRKKFTMLLASLFLCIGAWAQLTVGSVYSIQNKQSGNAISQNANHELATVEVNIEDNAQLWIVEEGTTEGTVMFRNLESGRCAQSVAAYYTHWYADYAARDFYVGEIVAATDNAPAYYYISYEAISDVTKAQQSVMHQSNGYVVRWEQTNNNSQWAFVEVAVEASKLAEITETWKEMASAKTKVVNELTNLAKLSIYADALASIDAVNAVKATGTTVAELSAASESINAILANCKKQIDGMSVKFTNCSEDGRGGNYLGYDKGNNRAAAVASTGDDVIWTIKVQENGSFKLYNFVHNVYLGVPADPTPVIVVEADAPAFDFIVTGEDQVALVTGGKMVHVANHSNYKLISHYSTTDKASLWTIAKTDDIVVSREQYDAAATAKEALPYAIQQAYGLVTDAANYYSNYKSEAEGSYEALLDNTASTFFHSAYNNEAGDGTGVHYIQANLGEGGVDEFYFYMAPRQGNGNNRPKEITVAGSNDANGEFVEIAKITTTLDGSMTPYVSEKLGAAGTKYQYIRLTVTSTNTSTVFFTLSELYFFPATADVTNLVNSYNAFATSSITSEAMASAAQALVNAETTLALANIKKEVAALLSANENNHAATPALGQYPSGAYNALSAAYTATDATQESLEAAIAAFEATLNIPVYFITSKHEGYAAGSAIYYDGAWKWKAANKFDKQMWMTIPGYTEENVPAVDAYDAEGTSYAICDYLTGTKMRGKDVQIVKVADWEGAYNLQYNANAESTDAAQHAKDNGQLVNWKPGTSTDAKASVWGVEYIGGTYDLDKLTDGHISALADMQAAYSAKVRYADVVIGDGIGQYQGNKDALVAALEAAEAISGKSLVELAKMSVDDILVAKNAINNAEALVINQPKAGFYRIKSMNSSLKPGNNGKSLLVSDGALALDETESAASIMYIDAANGILNYGSGLYINTYKAPAEVGAQAVGWNFIENAQVAGTYALKYNDDADGQMGFYLSDWTGNVTYGQNDANAAWIFEEVTELPVVVTAAGYATLFAPVALSIPEGVTAYTGTVNGEYLTLNAVEGTIPANTGVILEAEPNTYNFTVSADVAAIEGNALKGSAPKSVKNADKKVYTLQNGTNGVGLYRFNGVDSEGNTTYINGFRAWVELNPETSVNALRITRGDETRIEQLINNENVVIYDLAGRRVQKMEKGIYIVNGRKVVVK